LLDDISVVRGNEIYLMLKWFCCIQRRSACWWAKG